MVGKFDLAIAVVNNRCEQFLWEKASEVENIHLLGVLQEGVVDLHKAVAVGLRIVPFTADAPHGRVVEIAGCFENITDDFAQGLCVII